MQGAVVGGFLTALAGPVGAMAVARGAGSPWLLVLAIVPFFVQIGAIVRARDFTGYRLGRWTYGAAWGALLVAILGWSPLLCCGCLTMA